MHGSIVTIVIGPSDSWFMAWKGVDNQLWCRSSVGFEKEFVDAEAWLEGNNYPIADGALGQNGRFIMFSSTNSRWRCPLDLDGHLTTYLKPYYGTVTVTSCSFGVDDTYFVLLSTGRYFYQLKDKYPALLEVIKNQGFKSFYSVQLHPTKPELYFASFTDGTIHWSLPPSWNGDILSIVYAYSGAVEQAKRTSASGTAMNPFSGYAPPDYGSENQGGVAELLN
ncbi:hypothetical protein BT69DRAFT_1340338, partial [Atractiella rhizophila]